MDPHPASTNVDKALKKRTFLIYQSQVIKKFSSLFQLFVVILTTTLC